MVSTRENASIRKSIGRTSVGGGRFFTNMFGCRNCPLIDSVMCPHNDDYQRKKVEKHHKWNGFPHPNGICKQRVDELKELYERTNKSTIRLIQQDNLVKSQITVDKMRLDFANTGNMPSGLPAMEKNLNTLAEKMRAQDEGIKIRSDVLVTHDRLREIVEVSAKVIEDKKNVKVIEQQRKIVRESSIFKSPDVQE